MSGFDGRIAFEGDKDRCRQLLGRAIKHANVQRQSKNILKQASSTRAYDLGGGAYCVIVDLAHMRAIHIVAPTFEESAEVIPEDPPPFPGRVGPGVYDVLSGYVFNPQIVIEEITDSKGKKKKYEVIKGFSPTSRTNVRHPKDLYRRQRLAVKENEIFAPVNPTDNIVWSEHAHVKPSNYTGAMQRCVQVLMGIGKILRPTTEETLMPPLKPLPPVGKDLITKQKREMISAFGLYGPHYGDFTPRIDFDYRVAKTHGLCGDKDGVWWVIEIGMRGVHAMRLYLDPVSQTYEGAKRWTDISPELTNFVIEFAGIPLGITLPTFEKFDKWKRAGEIIELISEVDMRTFYSKAPMSSDTGWAFNELGSQAHNTCWEYGLDEIKRCYHYQISFALQGERFAPWTPARSTLASRFSTIFEVNKCRRMEEKDAQKILNVYAVDGIEAGNKAFDEFVVKPTLIGQATMSLRNMGKAYHPAKFDFQPQIKYPEHVIDALLSFDFSDASFPRKRKTVECHAPMYVCFIDGELDVIYYAYDNTQEAWGVSENYSTRQECQSVGSWMTVWSSEGPITQMGNFYSNRWDFRDERKVCQLMITTFNGKKLAAYPRWRQRHPLSTAFYAWTEITFYITGVSRDYGTSPILDLSVACVNYSRNAYYIAVQDRQSPARETQYFSNIESHHSKEEDEWDIFHRIFAWVGPTGCPQNEWIDQSLDSCWARKRCLWINEDACFDDNLHQGFWGDACKLPNGYFNWEFIDWPVPIPPSTYSYKGPPDEGTIISDVHFINDTKLGAKVITHYEDTYTGGSRLSPYWWISSPTPEGYTPSIKAVNSCEGEEVTNLMDDLDGNLKHIGGPQYMWAGWTACYTGVIE